MEVKLGSGERLDEAAESLKRACEQIDASKTAEPAKKLVVTAGGTAMNAPTASPSCPSPPSVPDPPDAYQGVRQAHATGQRPLHPQLPSRRTLPTRMVSRPAPDDQRIPQLRRERSGLAPGRDIANRYSSSELCVSSHSRSRLRKSKMRSGISDDGVPISIM